MVGFGCRVTANGARSYIFNYRSKSGRQGRLTIGACSNWSASVARAKAKALRHQVDGGGDPQMDVDEERKAPTVNDLCGLFEERHLVRKRATTAVDYRRILKLHIRPALGTSKVADISFSDIDALHRKITRTGGPYVANRTVAVLS